MNVDFAWIRLCYPNMARGMRIYSFCAREKGVLRKRKRNIAHGIFGYGIKIFDRIIWETGVLFLLYLFHGSHCQSNAARNLRPISLDSSQHYESASGQLQMKIIGFIIINTFSD